MPEGHFYDHFQKDRPTGLGMWLTTVTSRRIFAFAGIKAGDSVLEIGPGRGVFAELCLQHRAEYTAIEPNEQLARSLEAKGAQVIRAIVPPLPAVDRSFDVVVMIHVMEHINTMRDALELSVQIERLLKPAGRFVICSPDYLNLRGNFFNCDFSHNFVTTRRRLEQLLTSAGLANMRSCHLAGPFKGVLCWLISAFVSRLPFGWLEAMFADSTIIRKLYKLQLNFSRTVLIVGRRTGSD